MHFIDIHTHKDHFDKETISVRNIYPGEGFGAFNGYNYYSVGLHPWHVLSTEENNVALKTVKKSLEFDHVIFIGECGLDNKCSSDFKEQKRVFEKQVEISEEFKKPLIIHCVKAIDDIIVIRKKLKPSSPWIFHGFTGNVLQAKQLLSLDFKFSFGKILFNEHSKAIESYLRLPLDSIFFETDEFSESISSIYKRAAELRDMDFNLLVKSIEYNFKRLRER